MSYRYDIYDLPDTDEPVATVSGETSVKARAAAQEKVQELRRLGKLEGPVYAAPDHDTSGTPPTPGERRKAQALATLLVVCCVAALIALFSM